jgi:hypothetical protein
MEDVMEPKNSPIKSTNLIEVSLPTVLCPVDAEDYFELACEADEFGVHVHEHSTYE